MDDKYYRICRIFVDPRSLFYVAVNPFSTMPLMESVIPNLSDPNDGDSDNYGCCIPPHIASPYVDGLETICLHHFQLRLAH